MSRPTPPVALTIAGTDSGAGAGVGADLKAFAAEGVHGVFAVTVVTAQSTTEVRAVHPMPVEMVQSQVDAVTDDFAVQATKTGLLWGAGTVRAVAERASRLGRLVVDPVLVNSKRVRIQPPGVDEQYRSGLFPAALVLTPNVAEAELLLDRSIATPAELLGAARHLRETGAEHVVVTGLLDDERALDAWAGPEGAELLSAPLVDTRNIHGTGCSFAATVAARLAHGDAAAAAIPAAKASIAEAIAAAADWTLGAGQGPIDHFWRNRHV